MTKKYEVYISTAPGLEHALKLEIQEKFPDLEVLALERGGVSLICSFSYLYKLNKKLKVASRVRFTFTSFKSKDFPKLFKKIIKLPWKEFIYGENVEVISSSRKSRLFHTDKINKVIKDAIVKYFINNPAKKKDLEQSQKNSPVKIYARFVKDVCKISIDTSDLPLHIRGENKTIHKGSIRENIAAALYVLYKRDIEIEQNSILLDPMCGSGTLPIEIKNYFDESYRVDYANIKGLNSITESLNDIDIKTPFKKFLLNDIESSRLDIAMKNFSRLCESHLDLASFTNCDLFELEVNDRKKLHIITNPPYNKKVKINQCPFDFYEKLINHLITNFSPVGIGIIIPSIYYRKYKFKNYKQVTNLSFENGGLKMNYIILNKQLF